jgi:hypothetical protein
VLIAVDQDQGARDRAGRDRGLLKAVELAERDYRGW